MTKAKIGQNKEIVSVLYERIDDTKRRCLICQVEICQDEKAGFKNLISHLSNKHEGYEDVAKEILDSKGKTLLSLGGKTLNLNMFLDKNATSTYEWMQLVILENLPLTALDNINFKRAVKYQSLSSKTFKQRLFKVKKD